MKVLTVTLEQAFFILEHSSSEGEDKYFEAVKTIKEKCMPVVRCKDCRNGIVSDNNKYIICCRLGICMEFDDFCSRGTRKGESNES